MRNLSLLFLSLFLFIQCKPVETTKVTQNNPITKHPLQESSPKLVVGVVVDQMRYDYLTRFWDRYGDDGFKRLIDEGFLFKNAHYNYMPTYTAPGHASIFTGTSPRFHGILSNSYYDKFSGRFINSVGDDSVQGVGTERNVGKRSPQNLLASTMGDQNRIHTQFRAKTIGISLKERAAILPAGRSANAAYWYSGEKEGNFVTSTFYMDELPQWVKDFNDLKRSEEYLRTWTTMYPIETYLESGEDLNDFEKSFKGKEEAIFDYDLKAISEGRGEYGYDLLKYVPFGNDLTTEFALAAIDGENLGQREETDFLSISFSAPDYIGHRFGVNAKEIQDNYLRLDASLARLLEGLDEKLGKGEYVLFLTADHGAGHVPGYLKSKKIAAGYYDYLQLNEDIKQFAQEKLGDSTLIRSVSNFQVFYDRAKMDSLGIKADDFSEELVPFLLQKPLVAQVYTRNALENGSFDGMVGSKVKNGFNPKRSGEVAFVLEPEVISNYSYKGSTHGSPYTYDTHVPIFFYGKGIQKGSSFKEVEIIDIAPTITAMLGIAFPNATYGKVLSEIFMEK